MTGPCQRPTPFEPPPHAGAPRAAIIVVLIAATSACGGKVSTSLPGSGGTTADAAVDQVDVGTGGVAGAGSGGTLGTGGVGSGGTGLGGASGRGGAGVGGAGGRSGTGGAGGSQVGSCPGYVRPSGNPCRTSTDCFGGICTATPSPPGCGFQSQPMRLCLTDADCTNGFCLPAKTKAPCAISPDIVCIPRCTATSCAAGERCGADGHCQIFPCAEGFTCPVGRTCAPTRTAVDPNGCAAASCATDGWTCSVAHTHCEPAANAGVDIHGCAPDNCATGAWTCGANQACGAPGDLNGCHCTSDAACGINSRCAASSGLCQTKSCTVDTDCDCGVCINQTCQPGLWACQLQVG